jgi:LmbE family N-acetylglucosaminyl deacetylase
MTRRLLAIFAHADDETLLAGALLARYAGEGAEVRLICAAPGDEEQEQRLTRAAGVLGISDVSSLRYDPSPMWPAGGRSPKTVLGGAPLVASEPVESVAPLLTRAPAGDLVTRMAGRLDDFMPEAVLTHSPYGDYGHPDHIIVHRAVVEAFRVAPRPGARLYCLAYPLPLVRLNEMLMRLSGRDTRRMGPDGTVDLHEAVRAAPAKTCVVDVTGYVAVRQKAAAVYNEVIASGPLPLRMIERSPVWFRKRFFGRAAVTRLIPPPQGREAGLL